MSKLEDNTSDSIYSAAISLKRIADALEKLAHPPIFANADMISEEEIVKAFSQPGHIVSK